MAKVEMDYKEHVKSIDKNGKYKSVEIRYIVFEAADEDTALTAVLGVAAKELNDLPLDSIEIDERCGDQTFKINALYKTEDISSWYFVIRFLAATGARVSELIQLKVEHIRLGYLDLYSKGGKLRRIYIPCTLQKEALEWLMTEKRRDSGFVFLNRYSERITTRGISGQLKKLAIRYGLDPVVVYPHSFRHRFAKSFLERCNDIAFLADLMGHESIETTRIYLRKTATEQRSIVDKVVTW